MAVAIARIRAQRFACISFLISFAEVILVWGSIGIALSLPGQNWKWLGSVLQKVVVVGFSSIVIAIVGLFLDPERVLAFLALILGMLVLAICAVPAFPPG